MSIQDFYESRSYGSHLLHGFFAPTSFVNPFFYEGLYESTQDDTTGEFVAEHLFYLSPWLPAAVFAGQSPFHIWSSGLQIMRYVAADAGLFGPIARSSIPFAVGLGVSKAMTSDHVLLAREEGFSSPYRYAASRGAWSR